MGWAIARDLPPGQKNAAGDVVVKNEPIGEDRVRIKYFSSAGQYYTKEYGAGDKVRNHCCGSCKAAGTYSNTQINKDDKVSKQASNNTRKYKGHGI